MPTDYKDRDAANDQPDPAPPRALFVFRAGARLFAVPAAEVEVTARDLTPTPLPSAPRAVLGVVSLRGRIRTVVDPLRLDGDVAPDDNPPRLFVALTGDEQLALACDSAEGEMDIAPARLAPPDDPRSHLRGTFDLAGARVALLDTSRLFDAATRGTERRRRRS